MAGMSSLVRIVNAGVPGSQDRVDVVLRDGVVASVGPAGTVSASDSTMQTKAHTTSLEYATNAIASGSVSIPTSAAAPADETTIDADGLWVIPGLWDCHTHFTQWAKTLGRLDLINARSAAVLGTESSDREPFQPEQCLDVHTSLAASTATGRDRLASGDPADVVLLDADPYAADTPEAMRAMPQHVVMTLLCGERTY